MINIEVLFSTFNEEIPQYAFRSRTFWIVSMRFTRDVPKVIEMHLKRIEKISS